MSQLVIIGATGVLGSATAKLFLKNKQKVKAFVRDPSKAADLELAGADIVKGDLIDPSTFTNIFNKEDVVLAAAHSMLGKGSYTSSAVDNKGHKALIDAAAKAGVQQFIYCSAYGADPNHPIDFFRTKYDVEQHLIKSGLNYTILRPSAFMEWHVHNLLGKSLVEKGKAMLPGQGNSRSNFICADDIAQFILYVFTKEEFYKQVIELGGNDNLTKNEIAALYKKYLNGKATIKHVPRGVLKAFSILLKPVHPGLARILKVGLYADKVDGSLDGNTSIQRFGITPTKAEDFIKTKVINQIKP